MHYVVSQPFSDFSHLSVALSPEVIHTYYRYKLKRLSNFLKNSWKL